MVVGGGTIGAWCAWFLRRAGLERVVLVEAGTLGKGASSRAAGMVRAQGGTEAAVRLGLWTRDFYRGQRDELGIDSGFVEQGYCMPCFTDGRGRRGARADRHAAARWGSTCAGSSRTSSTSSTRRSRRACTLGSSYAPGDGYIDPPRNVLAYTAALVTQRRRGARGRRRSPGSGRRVAR